MMGALDPGQLLLWRKAQIFAQWQWKQARTPTRRELHDVRLGPAANVREYAGSILVPMRDECGELWSLQDLRPRQPACFGLHARVSGLFHQIGGSIENAVAVVVHMSEAIMLAEEEGCPAVVAFTPDNLAAVAQGLRIRHPHARTVIWTARRADEPAAQAAAIAACVDFANIDDAGLIFGDAATSGIPTLATDGH